MEKQRFQVIKIGWPDGCHLSARSTWRGDTLLIENGLNASWGISMDPSRLVEESRFVLKPNSLVATWLRVKWALGTADSGLC